MDGEVTMPFKDEAEMRALIAAMWAGGDTEGARAGALLMELWDLQTGRGGFATQERREIEDKLERLRTDLSVVRGDVNSQRASMYDARTKGQYTQHEVEALKVRVQKLEDEKRASGNRFLGIGYGGI